jgi:hypothetical protein
MTWSVYQHWDPLKVCVVGRSYPPEFYSWIKIKHVRNLFEKIATETEEDFQTLINKLQEFGVEVLRPNLPDPVQINGKYVQPPMTPRDDMVMIQDQFYCYDTTKSIDDFYADFYSQVKDPSWPECRSQSDFLQLPARVQQECINLHSITHWLHNWQTETDMTAAKFRSYADIFERVKKQGNQFIVTDQWYACGAMVSRIGQDLYFATESSKCDIDAIKTDLSQRFLNTRNHVINTGGHGDGTYCPVCPGLIISLQDVPTYADTFPGWEVVYLPGQSWDKVRPFLDLKLKNQGKWWIPGFEYDTAVTNLVTDWLEHWTGYVEETVFDVNMLMVDPTNVIVFNHNEQVFSALQKFGITPHVVPLRHRYFWDGGIHCVTVDLDREGQMQDYFPERSQTKL